MTNTVPLEKYLEMIKFNKSKVHTFRSSPGVLIGADWSKQKLLKAIKKFGIAESGPSAVAMGHGLVLIDEHGPLFIETRSEK
jgi:hypothetical protein